MSLAPELHVEKQYIEGYVPSSFDAPHSSLQRSSTWIAMGLILSSLAGFGFLMYGLATHTTGSQESAIPYAIGGGVLGLIFLFGGFLLVHIGRKNYREYKERSGRIM